MRWDSQLFGRSSAPLACFLRTSLYYVKRNKNKLQAISGGIREGVRGARSRELAAMGDVNRTQKVKGQMHGTLEQLRDRHPGKWLLIQLDGSEAEEGTVLAAYKNPELVDKELERYSRLKMIHRKPLYVTYSIPEGQELPAFAL